MAWVAGNGPTVNGPSVATPEYVFTSFLFSRRMRHTTSLCDWSSDVCSSALRFDVLCKLAESLIGSPTLPVFGVWLVSIDGWAVIVTGSLPQPELDRKSVV